MIACLLTSYVVIVTKPRGYSSYLYVKQAISYVKNDQRSYSYLMKYAYMGNTYI